MFSLFILGAGVWVDDEVVLRVEVEAVLLDEDGLLHLVVLGVELPLQSQRVVHTNLKRL